MESKNFYVYEWYNIDTNKEQNGRAIIIDLYDESWNFIKRFSYIGECAEFLHKNYNFSSNAEVVRCGIRRSIKYDVPYKGFRFKKHNNL